MFLLTIFSNFGLPQNYQLRCGCIYNPSSNWCADGHFTFAGWINYGTLFGGGSGAGEGFEEQSGTGNSFGRADGSGGIF